MSDLTAAIARVRAATTFADGEPMPDGALPHDDFYCGELRTLIAAAERAAAQPVAWQPIATAPEGRVVLVFYKNQLGNGRTMRARYYLPETLESEQTESGWADEGWYEESEAYEYLMPLEHEPTHWMPMPAAPDAAAPAQAEPPADALVEEESISDMLSRHDRETRAAILRAHHKMIGAEAKRDAVERQMQTFNAVVQERDAKIVEATERAERAESALAAANERAEGMRVALEAADGMRRGEDCPMCDAGTLRNPAKLHWDSCAFANYDIARAALARKEGE